MMKIFTKSSLKGIPYVAHVFLVIILLTLFQSKSYAQTKVYANSVSAVSPNGMSSLLGCGTLGLGPCYNTPTVDNATNATNSDNSSFATVKSFGGVALGLAGYSGQIDLKFADAVPANTTTYIRLDFDGDVLNALLGGNLGGLLANVGGNVILGNHSFEVGAKNAAGTTVLSGSSTAAFSSPNLRLVKDANGYFYVAITPTQAYDRVYVKDVTSSLLLGTTNSTKVYYAFHASGNDPCAQAFSTGFEGTGITLDALQLGGSGVINSQNAIDANPNNYSTLSLGILGVGATVSQNFYFLNPSNPGDDFNLRFSSSSALLTAGVLNNITVTAYNGNTQVYTASAASLLNLDLLGLLNSGAPTTVPFSPGVTFDRVKVSLGIIVNLNLAQSINIYGVTRTAGRPTFTAPATNAVAACYNSPAALTATTLSANELIWYDAIEGGTPLATVAYNGTFTTPALTANKTYYVAARRSGCTLESGRVPVAVTVNPQIVFNGSTLTNATPGFAYAKQLDVATGGTPGFTYALAPGSTLPAGLSLSSAGIITGTPTSASTATFSVVAKDSKNCTATANYTLTVTTALALTPGTLPEGITGTIYPTQTIPAATGGTGPYTYTANNLPPGLTFNPATREITGTPTVPGQYTIPVTVTDANGNAITSNYTVKVTNPLVLPAATLANGTTGTVYPTQIIPSATGGTTPYTYSATGLPPGLSFNPTTRAITGTPTASGTFTTAVTVTDADGKTVTTNYAIVINDQLLLPSATLPNGTEGVAYAAQTLPAAVGGVGPYTYVATGIPAGLTFNPSTRQITGTPTQAGNYTISATATDSEGRTASNTYALRVVGTLNLPGKTLPDGTVGNSYLTQTLPAVSGGTSPYTYAVAGLPAGLTFNPATREISGTPTQGGTYSVALTATDANNNKATTSYALNVGVTAPVVASATVCAGSTTTLTVSNLQAGVSYNWYASTGSTPLATNNNGTFVTPAVTAATVFYVEAVSGTAASTKTQVSVAVNPPATLATVTTNNPVINSGQSTTLRATADSGNTIAWFDSATGGTQVGSGTSFTTPALTANTTYYVQTTSAAGCTSLTRVPVTVTVISNNGSTACNAANSQSTGINGICVACSITGAGNSTDANASNFTRLSLGVGVGATGYQQLIFPTTGVATDSIRLDLALPGGLADVNVLNNITVTVLNGSTVVSTTTINGGLLNLSLLGGNRFAATVLAGGAYDRVQVSFGATVSALNSLDIYGATVVYPSPTLTSGAQTVCNGATATLSATANGGTTLAWFDAPTGGTQLGTGETFTTPALTTTTTYYIQVSKASCPNPIRVPVTVTVNPAIVFAGTTLANATIASPYNVQLSVATGGTPGYTYALSSGSTLPAGLTLSSAGLISGTPTATGDPTLSVTVTDSKNCSATATFNLVTSPALTLTPGALPDGITGTPYTSNGIPAATGGTGPYIYSATNLPPGLTFNTTTREITGTPTQPGNYTIPVTVSDATGNTITANYTVAVVDPLVLPAATLANGTTGSVYTTQIIPSATGGTAPYTYVATGLPDGLAFDPSTREITGTPTQAGTFTIPVTVTDAAGRTATNSYTITIGDPLLLPNATLPDGTEGTVYAAQTLPAAVGGTSPYTYVASNLPAGLTFDATTRQITGTPTEAGNYSIGLTATDNAGKTVSNTYSLRVIGVLSLPGATLPNGIVGTSYPTQTLPAVSGGTGPYTYLATGIPPGLSFNTATREITGTPTLGGTYTVSLTATDAEGNSATSTYSLVVNVNAPVVAAATVCSGSSATLSVSNLQAGVTYNWYASAGSTPLATNNTGVFATPVVTSQTVFYVEAVSGTAVSARTAVTVSVNPDAAPATIITNNQVINAGQTANLSATADAGSTISWYADTTGGTALATGASFTTPALSTTTTYYVETVNAAGCASITRVPVTVTVINGDGGSACNAASTQNSGITGVCLLCGITGARNSTDANPSNFTRITLAVGVGSTGYQQLIFNTPGTATDSIRLDLALPGGLADVGLLSNVTLNVMNGTTVVRTVQLNSSLLSLQLLSGNRFTATIPAGGAYDRVQVSLGGVISAVTSLDVYGATAVYPSPTLTAGNQTICAGGTATLSATANGGTTLAWFDTPTGGTALATGETFTTPALTATTTYYIEVSKGTCANTTRIPVVVTVTPSLPTPVLATIADVCEGSPATLSVANPAAGTSYRWYDAATGGNLVFTGEVFTTPALSANATYYVEAAQGNCTSATRAVATVSVNPRPELPIVSANTTTVAAGQTAIITASATDATNTFNWYTSANATTPIYTGAIYVTPPLTATTNYYIESVSTNGCTSSNRVQITITVDGNGSPNPVPCEGAIAQTNGVNGVALLSGVFNPTLSIDNDTQTASSLVMPVGAVGASVYQRLSFGSASRIGDTVRVVVSTPGKLLSLALLANASVTTYLGTNSNGDAKLLNSNLLNIQLLSGGTQAEVTFVPTAIFNNVEVRLNAGVLGALTSLDVNYAQRILAAPTVSVSNVTACVGATAQLAVSNPSSDLTYRWYDEAGNYLAGKDGVIFTTPALTGDTKFYVAAVSATGCVSYRTPITVTTNPAPVAPTLLNADVSTCLNTAVTLQVNNPVVGTTYNWYDSATSTTVLFTGDNFTTPVITANRSYFVSATNACGTPSARTEATITLGTIDIPVITPPSITITSNSVAILKATSSTAGATINWYDAPVAGNLLFTGDTFVTPQLTATTTYYAEASVPGGCIGIGRAAVTVTVTSGPPITTPCGSATTTVASGVTGIAVGAGVINPTLAVDNDTNTGSSLVIPVGALGASVYHQVGFPELSNIGDTLRVKVTVPAQLLSVALLQNLTLTTFQGSTSNNDVTSISNPLITLNLLAGGSTAILTYVPTSRYDGVELRLNSGILGALTSVNFDYAQRTITKPTVATATAVACEGATATLNVTNPQAGIVYKWYLGSVYQTGKDGTTFTTDPALAAGTYVYNVTATATATGCESAATPVTVTILPPPATPVLSNTNPATACVNSPATLSVQAVAGVIYNWYDAATGGNRLVSNNSSFTTSASLAPGVYTYYVEAVNGNSCANATRTPVSITVNPAAIASDIAVAGGTSLCASGTTVLTASSTTVTNPVFNWYSDAGLTVPVFEGATFTTPAITASTKYYVTVKGTNKCANTPGTASEVSITVNPVAVAADISLSGTSTICGGSSVVLTASSTTVTNPVFTWYSAADLSTVAFTGSVFTTPNLNATTTYYVTVKGDNKCENSAATAKAITITVNPVATDADITLSGSTSICSGATAALSATAPTVVNPVFTWYSDAALSNVAFVGPNFTTPALTATTTYYVTVRGDNKCENSTAKAVTVNVKEIATAADISVANAEICSGSTVMLMASSTTVTQPVFTWYSDASLTVPVFTGPTFTVTGLSNTTTYYVTVRGANKCENTAAGAKVVTVTVNPLATTTDIIVNGGTTACAGSPAVLSATSPTVNNPVFTWYSDPALTNISYIGATFTTPVLSGTTTYYVTVKGDNKCENAAGTAKVVTVTVTPVATNADITAADATICAGSNAVLSASSTTVTNPTFTWYNDAALTSVAFVGASFNTPALSGTTKYYLTVKGDNKCENASATAKVVTVTVNAGATQADVTVSQPSIVCGSGTAVINASSTTVANPVFTWYRDASLTVPVYTGAIFTTPNLTATTTYYVTVKGSDKCENTAANAVAVTVVVNPTAVASDITVSGSTAICGNAVAVLTASSTTVTNPVFTWYSDAALTNPVFTGSVFTTPALSGNATYYVTVKGDNKCENLSAAARAVAVTINAAPENPVVSTTGTNICAGEATTLTISNAQNGVTYQWYSAATGGNLLFTGQSYTTAVLTATTDFYVIATGAGGCNNSGGRVRVTVTVNAKPGIPTVASSAVSACAGSSIVLSVTSPQTGVTYNWYTTATGGSIVGTGANFTTPPITANATYYVEGTNGSCVSTARTAVNVNASPVPVAPTSVTAANGIICSGSTTVLTVNNPTAGLIYTWFAASASGSALAEGTTFTTPALTATTTYYVESVAASGCLSATRTPVTVNVLPVLERPVVVVQATTANSVNFAWSAVTGATAYEVSLDNGLTWVNPTNGSTGTSYLVSGLKPDQSVTIIVRARGQIDCQTSANSSPVTGTAANPFGNDVYIPNAFTPNNDGKNDTFMIYGTAIAGAKLTIYTQWGQLIYQSDNMSAGWDGTYKGVNQPIGVYVYMAEITFKDGTTTMRKGTVTLIR